MTRFRGSKKSSQTDAKKFGSFSNIQGSGSPSEGTSTYGIDRIDFDEGEEEADEEAVVFPTWTHYTPFLGDLRNQRRRRRPLPVARRNPQPRLKASKRKGSPEKSVRVLFFGVCPKSYIFYVFPR